MVAGAPPLMDLDTTVEGALKKGLFESVLSRVLKLVGLVGMCRDRLGMAPLEGEVKNYSHFPV